MKISFPAIKAFMGKREYYAAIASLGEIPRLFTFTDVADFTAEHRSQRALNKGRVQPIARYILDNEDGYLFSSIVASYQGNAVFLPSPVSEYLGTLELDLGQTKFVINDGQHRSAGIAAALRENPDLGQDSISVLFFPFENLGRTQQMFSDLNRYVVKTPTALNILFDKRDPLAQVVLATIENVPVFRGLTDKERVSLSPKSTALFTLVSLYDAGQEFLAQSAVEGVELLHADKVEQLTTFWDFITTLIPDWKEVKEGRKTAADVRRDTISAHSVILRAIGSIGGEVKKLFPQKWQSKLKGLAKVDWRKTNSEWLNVVIVGNSVVSSRQARVAARELLWRMLDLPERVQETITVEEVKEVEKVKEVKKLTAMAHGNSERKTQRKKAA